MLLTVKVRMCACAENRKAQVLLLALTLITTSILCCPHASARIMTSTAMHVSSKTPWTLVYTKVKQPPRPLSLTSDFKCCYANFEPRRCPRALPFSHPPAALVAATMSPLIASAWIMPGEWAGCRQVERPSNFPAFGTVTCLTSGCLTEHPGCCCGCRRASTLRTFRMSADPAALLQLLS